MPKDFQVLKAYEAGVKQEFGASTDKPEVEVIRALANSGNVAGGPEVPHARFEGDVRAHGVDKPVSPIVIQNTKAEPKLELQKQLQKGLEQQTAPTFTLNNMMP